MKKLFLLTNLFIFISLPLVAQQHDINYSIYGFVRAEGFYNTRSNADVCDGLHYLYPLDHYYDENGKDINSISDNGFYSYNTRLGLDLQGPNVGKAKLFGKIETDFAGNSSGTSILRIRHAYLKLSWDQGSSLLLGQTWHPFWGDFVPQVMDLSVGSPFQLLNRSPMLQYSYRKQNLRLQASAIYQSMMKSYGPNGSSNEYMRKGGIPELVLGLDYISDNFNIGANIEFLSLRPRTESKYQSKLYKVSESVSSFSYEIHAKYKKDLFSIAAKSALSSNMAHCMTLGGYGIHSEDNSTGEREYTPFTHSTSWINATYGDKYQISLFGGYTKNLGTNKSLLTTETYGRGLDIDQLIRASVIGSYNLPHWQLGVEYSLSTAWYGNMELSSGKVKDTHSVTNHRIACVATYFF